MRPQCEYREKYVAFLDILGFGELVEQSVENPVLMQELSDALNRVETVNWDQGSNYRPSRTVRATAFSDSVVISADADDAGLRSVLGACRELSLDLLHVGCFFVRGGISRGLIHHGRSQVFGPAMNEAYRLESKVASAPRIVLSPKVYSHYRPAVNLTAYFEPFDRTLAWSDKGIRIDEDGCIYVNILAEPIEQLSDAWFCSLHDEATYRTHKDVVYFEKLRDRIQNRIDTAPVNERITPKMQWVTKYFNTELYHEGNRMTPLRPPKPFLRVA